MDKLHILEWGSLILSVDWRENDLEELRLYEIAGVLEGKLKNCKADFCINGITNSIRDIRKGDLYISFAWKKSNIKAEVQSAIDKGASAVMTKRAVEREIPQIIVKNTFYSLRKLSKYYRNKFNIPFVVVTGSYGKTSTRGIITSVLQERLRVHKTEQDVNGPIGVPLTLLKLDNSHDISVLELGFPGRAGYMGVLRRTAKLVKPSIGVITNIGTAHLETLGSKEKVFKAKMEIAECLSNKGILIVNGDDEYLSTLSKKPYKIIKTSLKGKGDYNATEIANHGEKGVSFKCKIRGVEHIFKINVPGIHNVNNALMAIAIGDIYKMDIEDIKRGISSFKSEGLRMNIIRIKENVTVIEDCFNANLDSVKSSLDVLRSFKGGRKIAVLGGMLELGNFTEEAHRQVGKYLVGKCDILLTYGSKAQFVSDEVKNILNYRHFNEKKELSSYLGKILKRDDVILVKGSRKNRMEEVVEYLTLNYGK